MNHWFVSCIALLAVGCQSREVTVEYAANNSHTFSRAERTAIERGDNLEVQTLITELQGKLSRNNMYEARV